MPNTQYPDRQAVLLKIIQLIGEPSTPQERYIVAKAYAWSRVKYRDKAIYYLNLYLANNIYEGAYIHKHHNFYNTLEDEKKYHLSEMYNLLGTAYERNA